MHLANALKYSIAYPLLACAYVMAANRAPPPRGLSSSSDLSGETAEARRKEELFALAQTGWWVVAFVEVAYKVSLKRRKHNVNVCEF